MAGVIRNITSTIAHWPEVIADALGLKAGDEARPATGRLPERDRWEASRFASVWLGHATALLRLGRTTVLTDPVLSDRAGVDIGPVRLGRKRSSALPEDLDAALPPVDVVLLSHAHLDHWDRRTLERFAHRHTTAVIPRGTRRLLPRGFGAVVELASDQDVEIADQHITAIEPEHWGARFLWDSHRGCNAYLLEPEGPEHNRALFVGDSAHTDVFDVLADRHPLDPSRFPRSGVDLALMGIGGYHLEEHHATPEQVADMARRMNASLLMPIHHATFRGEKEPIDEPLERLLAAWDPGRIVCGRVGESWFGVGRDREGDSGSESGEPVL